MLVGQHIKSKYLTFRWELNGELPSEASLRKILRKIPRWFYGHELLALRSLKDFILSKSPRSIATARLSLTVLKNQKSSRNYLTCQLIEGRLLFFDRDYKRSLEVIKDGLDKFGVLVPLSLEEIGMNFLLDAALAEEDETLAREILSTIPKQRRTNELNLIEKTLEYRRSGIDLG